MKLRLYSPENYQRELGGDGSALRRSGFIAALKACKMLEDESLEYPLRRAAKLIRLAPEDFEVDEEHKALLLKRLPHGFPVSALDEGSRERGRGTFRGVRPASGEGTSRG